MSPRTRTPVTSRPGTPSGLGLFKTNDSTTPTMRSVSNGSSSSLRNATPCFHTTRPQFISGHIERCEACRLKYARQAESTANIPFSTRRPSGLQPRSQSRQSLNGSNRPSSAASVGTTVSHNTLGSNTVSAMRPSSRSSIASVASRGNGGGNGSGRRSTRPIHRRSSSAGSPLVEEEKRSDSSQVMTSVAEEAPLAPMPIPPSRADNPLSSISSSDGMPTSPTETVASRARARSSRNNTRTHGTTADSAAPGGGGERRQSRRGSSHSIHTLRRAGNDSPVGLIRTVAHRSASSQHPPLFPESIGDSGTELPVYIDYALMGSLVDQSRDADKYKAEIAELKETVRKLNRDANRVRSDESPKPQSSQSPDNIFGAHLSDAKQKVVERRMNLDRSALNKFEEFRKAYEDCESSLRIHPAQFTGERPLSPPPARNWGGGVSTPMRPLDGSDQDARRATINAAEVRRAGEDLMSTPVRRKPQPMARGTSTRRPTKSRMNRPLFGGDSELSDDGLDEDDFEEADDTEHRDLRNCLMSASNFGTFLVQYVTRQCLDYNRLCDENKKLMLSFDELEKSKALADKQIKRLEEVRGEHAAQAYDMRAQKEILAEEVELKERNARRMANDNEKLRHELVVSNNRCGNLDDQVTKANESLLKSRQRYEQEITSLRRNTNSLQQEKTTLLKKNDELRTELKGKLQRAGLKANVDEYLAERRRESAAAAIADADGSAGDAIDNRAANTGVSDGAAAENEIKRLQETVQFWRKKTDRANRKLRSEKTANKEAHRMLRIQQEETYRYQQTFGPLPDDIADGGSEVLGEFMSSMVGSPTGSLRRLSIYSPVSVSRSVKEAASDVSNDDLSSDTSDSSTGHIGKRYGRRRSSRAGTTEMANSVSTGARNARAGDSSFSTLSRESALVRSGSHSSLSNASEDDPEDAENADDKDILRYEMRMKNRRAIVATPRGRKSDATKSPRTIAGSRRNRNPRLSIDVDPVPPSTGMVGGESLGDILGVGSQWGDLASARSKPESARDHHGSVRSTDGQQPSSSLAAELGGIDGSIGWGSSNSPVTPMAASSPSSRPRARSIRGTAPPFGDRSNSFGLGFGESVSLAEQLSEAAKRQNIPEASKPIMIDASTSTDPLPEHSDAQVATALTSSSHADASVFSTLSPPSSEASVCTEDTEPIEYCSTGVDPRVGVSELVDNGTQTFAAGTGETGVQATTSLIHQQIATDPLIGVAHVGVMTLPASGTDVSVQTTLYASIDVGIATAVLVSNLEDKAVENVATISTNAVQAVPLTATSSMSTDPRVGVTESATHSEIVMRDQACQSIAATTEQGMSTDPLMGMISKQVQATATTSSTMMSTANPSMVDCGSDAILPKTVETATSMDLVKTFDMEVATDNSLLLSWLAPLIPEGIAASAVLTALAGKSEPIYEHYAKQVADDARAAARAEHERLSALSAEEAAACVKTYVDRAVSPEPLGTSDRAVQATPCVTSTWQQPEDMPVSHTGVDAPVPPKLTDTMVGTEHHTTTRWVEPFDPVVKCDIGVLATVETADRGTLHEINHADAATDSTVESKDASVSASASVADHSTSTDIVMRDASVGRIVDLCERSVSPIIVDVSSVAVGTDITTASKSTGTAISVADKTTSNVVEFTSVCIEAGCVDTVSVGTFTDVSTMEKGTDCEFVSMTDRGVQLESPNVSHVGVAAIVPNEHASVSTTVVSAPPTEDRGVYTSDLHTTSGAMVAESAAIAAPALMERGVSNVVSATSMATQTDSDQFEHVGHSSTSGAFPVDDMGVRAVESFESIGKSGSQNSAATDDDSEEYDDARAAQLTEEAPVLLLPRPGLRHSPTAPLPQLPPQTSRPSLPMLPSHNQLTDRPSFFPPTKAMSAMELERVLINGRRENEQSQLSRSSTPEKVSDGEDYGYIMVSPRTNVQHIQVSAISSSQSSSIANGSTRSKRNPLALFDRYSRSPSKRASTGSADPVLCELGRDDESDDGDHRQEVEAEEEAQEDEYHDHEEMSKPFDEGNADPDLSVAAGGENMHASASTAVDATMRMQAAFVARQPEPLIVQSIARTMVGAFMYKYTPTRFTHINTREPRHMRYFWIHPYAKMLNWSKQPPSGGTGLARSSRDNGSRSVYMRSIRIVEDLQSSSGGGDGGESGEPQYCIIVRTDHREIKIKATSQADHDLWYLAMSYLQSRRIITSTTYPTTSAAGGAGTNRNQYYPSDNSMHSRGTSMGSMESSQRVIANADRRQRDAVEERSRSHSRSRSRSRPRGPIQDFGDKPPVPLPPQPSLTSGGGYPTAVHNAGSSSVHLSSSVTGTSVGGGSSVRTGGSSAAHVDMAEPLSRQRNHRSTLDVAPGRVSSLQATPKSLRPVSMMPPSVTPGSGGGSTAKRLSIGFFRKFDGSTSSLLRHGSHASDDSHASLSLGQAHRDESVWPQNSIATAMAAGGGGSSSKNSGAGSSALSGGSNTVRKMFSGSFLRALRSRESVDDVDAA
ncbi:hypothetical protein H4217_000214 [Coemansia sp. RSA 1939]|nr:hypothetical protein H4217_000214 [Coemansia sp. RSA 1939]KAJ2618025.1 hypothetical protein EV177_000236 [Coemansia sp. RSA 1804]